MTNPIDSLPATPETVGMPRPSDVVLCHECGFKTLLSTSQLNEDDDLVYCDMCDGYDVEKVKP